MGEPAAGRHGDRQDCEWLRFDLTGRLVWVRVPAPGDEPALIEMATDARVRQYIGGPSDPASAAARAAQQVTGAQPGRFVIVERSTATVAGSGSLAHKRGPWEISYQLRTAFRGRGFAGEAVALVRDWFFTRTSEDLLIATTQRVNVASRRLLQRAGASHAGSFEQYGLAQERYEFRRAAPPTW